MQEELKIRRWRRQKNELGSIAVTESETRVMWKPEEKRMKLCFGKLTEKELVTVQIFVLMGGSSAM